MMVALRRGLIAGLVLAIAVAVICGLISGIFWSMIWLGLPLPYVPFAVSVVIAFVIGGAMGVWAP